MMGQSQRPAVQSASTPDAKCRKTMKIAGVSEALSPLKNASIQLIITPLIRRPQYLVAPPRKTLSINKSDT